MKQVVTTAFAATIISTNSALAEDVVSIWSVGAKTYLSAKDKQLVAGSESIGEPERFVLRSDGEDNSKRVQIRSIAGKSYGSYFVEDLGNSYFAFRTDNGRYLGCGKPGMLSRQAQRVGKHERFAVVPVREGAKVAIRAYQGWEAKILVDHPADFPTLRANINTLQLSALLDPPHKGFYTRKMRSDYRKSFSTSKWESEYILKNSTERVKADPGNSRLPGIMRAVRDTPSRHKSHCGSSVLNTTKNDIAVGRCTSYRDSEGVSLCIQCTPRANLSRAMWFCRLMSYRMLSRGS